MFFFMFLFMTFYQCFFIMFLNKRIGETPIIYYVLSHSIFWWTHWENPYHLLCAFSFYFSIFFENTHGLNPLLLRKPLPFTMCFPILFPGGRTEETPTIYYVLPHSISRRAHWGNPYHLLCASPSGSFYSPAGALSLGKPLLFTMCFLILFFDELDFLWKHAWTQPALTGETSIIYYVLPHRIELPDERIAIGETPIIYYVLLHPILRRARFSLKTRMSPTRSYWGNPYHLLCASPSSSFYFSTNALGTPLLFTMCFPIESCSSTSALPLGKPLLFSECFPSYRCSRLDIDPDRDRCQVISRDIGKTSII